MQQDIFARKVGKSTAQIFWNYSINSDSASLYFAFAPEFGI
jgi:hypothetical protein